MKCVWYGHFFDNESNNTGMYNDTHNDTCIDGDKNDTNDKIVNGKDNGWKEKMRNTSRKSMFIQQWGVLAHSIKLFDLRNQNEEGE